MTYYTWPILNVNGYCSVNDSILTGIYDKMVEEGKLDKVFYDGSVKTPDQWLSFIKNPFVFPVLVLKDDADIVGIAWLNFFEHKSARVHFCIFGKFHKGIADAMVNYWKGLKREDGEQMLYVLVGMTPEWNTATVHLMKIMGFQMLGTIPYYCYTENTKELAGASVGYLVLKEG